MSMKSILAMTGMAAMAMGDGFPGYGLPRTRLPQRKYPHIQPSYRHVGPVPKGGILETVGLKFKKDENRVNGHLISVDVDLVYASPKARAKKLRKYQMEIGEYIFSQWIGDLQKNEMFIVEPIIKEKNV